MAPTITLEESYYVVPDDCIGCGVCEKQCLSHAIFQVAGTDLWEILPDECAACGICAIYCPTDAILKD